MQVPVTPPIDSPDKLVETLTRAYEQFDVALFQAILANDPGSQAEFEFLLADPILGDEMGWGFAEEARIHQRLFHPEAPLPGEPLVPAELWPRSLTVILTRATPFTERADLYTTGGGTLDPERWRAMEAVYATYLLADLAGQTDYRIEGGARFVVLEDLEKQIGEPGKFLLLTWEDIRALPARLTQEGMAWSEFKRLYRWPAASR